MARNAAFATSMSFSPEPDPTPMPPRVCPSTMIGSPPGKLVTCPSVAKPIAFRTASGTFVPGAHIEAAVLALANALF
jgi:hypothetical protein